MGTLQQLTRARDKKLRGQFCPIVHRYDFLPTHTSTWVYAFDHNRTLTISDLKLALAPDVETIEREVVEWIKSQVIADGLDISRMVSPSPPEFDDVTLIG